MSKYICNQCSPPAEKPCLLEVDDKVETMCFSTCPVYDTCDAYWKLVKPKEREKE
jgi:hypothetical protein